MKLVAMGHKLAPSGLIDALGDVHPAALTPPPQFNIAKLRFTEREQEILRHLVRGSPNKVISRDLAISESAVKASVKCVLRKLAVQNRTQAAIIAHDIEFAPVLRQSSMPELLSNPKPSGSGSPDCLQ